MGHYCDLHVHDLVNALFTSLIERPGVGGHQHRQRLTNRKLHREGHRPVVDELDAVALVVHREGGTEGAAR